MKYKAGELIAIVGGMFSGKSTELQRQGRRKELAGDNVLYFKPALDNRYDQKSVETHDGRKVSAHVLETSLSILGVIALFGDMNPEKQTICIDEVQFWDKDIVKVIDICLMNGTDVVVSGLDMDRFGEPFGCTPILMAKAEQVIKLRAVCSGCGDNAYISAGLFESEEQNVVGEADKYTPLCRTCYNEKAGLI